MDKIITKQMDKEYGKLKKESDMLHKELTKDFTKEQFRLLSLLIDINIEIEKYCGA